MEQSDFAFQDSFGFINRMDIISPVFSTSKYYDLENIDKCLESNLKDNSIKGKLNALTYFAYLYHEFLQDAKGDKLIADNCNFIISEIDIRVSELNKGVRAKVAKSTSNRPKKAKSPISTKHSTTIARYEMYLKAYNILTREKKFSHKNAVINVCKKHKISEKTLDRAINYF
jgi:hypothetical protein